MLMGRFFLLTLCMMGMTMAGHAQNRHDLKVLNDSASYYFDLARYTEALTLLTRVDHGSGDRVEKTRTFLLQGKINEAEGHLNKALADYRRALTLATGASHLHMAGEVMLGIASTLSALDRADSVLWFCDQALRYDSSKERLAYSNLIKARFWQNRNENDQAMHFYQEAERLATELQDKKLTGLALTGIGMVYFAQYQDMDKALLHYGRAVKSYDSLRHANEMARTLTRMANAMMVLGKGPEANSYLTRAKRIVDISGNLPVKTYVLASIAILKTDTGDFNEVVRYAEDALAIKRQLGMKKQMQNDLLNLSEWYMQLKQYGRARALLTEAMAIARELKDVVYLHYFYETSSVLDSITGNYALAYSNLKRGMYYKDSAYSVRRIKAVEEIREKYENEQKEKVIAEKELVIQTQQNHLLVIIGIATISVLILVVVMLWLWNRQRTRLQLERERQGRARLQTIVATQEEVQQSIARDIHDGLVQVLGAAKMSLQAVDVSGQSDIVRQRIQHASQIMDEACTEARNISHQLLPYSLIKDGLRPAIGELARKGLGKIDYEFNSVMDDRFSREVEINVYRIAQEVIQNIFKHIGASKVDISLVFSNGNLKLDIRDNGRGFVTSTVATGAGFMNMKTRAELIGAEFHLGSQPGDGTRVIVNVKI